MSATGPAGTGDWTVVAQIVRPQGRKGEVLAELLTDFPERLAGREGLVLATAHFPEDGSAPQACRVVRSWLPKGRNEGRIVLALAGVETIADAERIAGLDLLVRSADRTEPGEDAVYVSDLIGCAVWDQELLLGTVREVHFPTSADGRRRIAEGAPLLVVDRKAGDGTDEVLVPFVKAFLVELNTGAKLLRMRLPNGLAEPDTGAAEPER